MMAMDDNTSHYKLPVIVGTPADVTLPSGTALVLEGGGMRGFYSAGVFEAFARAGIMFPYITAVSAGAANVLSYVSGQRGRNRLIIEHLVGLPQYVGLRNLLLHRTLFNWNFIFKTVPQDYLFWDQHSFDQADTHLLTGAFDCATGKTVWFEKSELNPGFAPTIASCSLPLLSPMVDINGAKFLDGGICDPIPIEKSIADGNTFHVVVLTRNAGYIKAPSRSDMAIRLAYRDYPQLVRAMHSRVDVYNRQLTLVEQLEQEGRALIIRPQKLLQVDRISSESRKLLALYDEGYADGTAALDVLCKFT